MRVEKEQALYKLIPKNLRNEYKIGMHGFGNQYWTTDENGRYIPNENAIQSAKEGIINTGLKINGDRLLLSTVKFEDLDTYVSTQGMYDLGGIIVALPKQLESESGKKMFLGSPNESSDYLPERWDRNRQATSYAEAVLVEGNTLPPMFILGTYSKDENGIEVNINEGHISFSNQIISDEYFAEIENRMNDLLKSGAINNSVIIEMQEQQKRYKGNRGILGKLAGFKGTLEGKKK